METRKAKSTCLSKNLRLPLGNIFLRSCSLGSVDFLLEGKLDVTVHSVEKLYLLILFSYSSIIAFW
jgi:hypothetical protein